jgi:glycosyltransferase involved in cell wall biosynthesis
MSVYFSLLGLAPSRIGGTEVFARELSLQLDKAGWHSVLCFLREPKGVVRDYLTLPNVSLEVMPATGVPGLADVPRGFELFRKYKPEIVHLQYVALLSPWPWLAQVTGARRIYLTDHTSRPNGYVAGVWPAWKRLVTSVFTAPLDGILTVSDYGDRCMRGLNLMRGDRVRRIYNGIDLRASGDGHGFRRLYGIEEGSPLVVQVCNMIREKGVDDLLDAARIVLTECPAARFALVGTGRLRAEFTQRAQSLAISHAVIFTDVVIDPVRSGAYAAADIVCQVSRWEEVLRIRDRRGQGGLQTGRRHAGRWHSGTDPGRRNRLSGSPRRSARDRGAPAPVDCEPGIAKQYGRCRTGRRRSHVRRAGPRERLAALQRRLAGLRRRYSPLHQRLALMAPASAPRRAVMHRTLPYGASHRRP